MTSNPVTSQGDVKVCDFCKHPVTPKRFEIAGTWRTFGYESCKCPENVANQERYEAAFRKEVEQHEEEDRRKRIDQLFRNSKIPERWKTRTFDHFTVNETNEKAYHAALEYVEGFNPRSGSGLLLVGPVGTGKTHLSAAVAMALMDKEHRVVFGTINSLLSQIRYSYEDDKESEKELFDQYTKCSLLVIDDLGKEKVTEWTEQLVFDIINTRYERLKPVLITTNLNLKDIRAKYRENGDALVDRIVEMCQGVRLDGDSWRRKGLA